METDEKKPNILALFKEMLDDHLGKAEFLKAFEQVIDHVKDNDSKTAKAVKEIADALTKKTDELGATTTEALNQLRSQVNEVFVGERLAEMQALIDTKLSGVDDRMARVKDGERGEKGDKGDDGQDGSPDTPIEIRDKLESLPEADKLVIDAVKGLRQELIKLAKKSGGGGASMPVAHWPIHETFTMNGTDTTVTLQQAIGAQGTAIFGLRYQGQVLDLTTHYTVDGNKITFVGFTPEANTTISVSYMP